MIRLQLDIDDIEELHAEKNEFMSEDLLNYGKKHIDAGNVIFIKRSYINAPDQVLKTFETSLEFESFWNSLFNY